MRAIIDALGANFVDMLIYVAIVLVFLVGILKCVIPVSRNRAILARAVRNIRDGEDAKRSWQEDNFLGRGALCAHWSEYLNNLFFADGVYHNASNVEDYINEETVIYGPGRASFSDAVPGLLVSLGFLGTLIGLARGLSGFSMANSQEAMNSIVTLIPGMRYAFMTSIFGVVGSVAFTMITRAVHGSTGRTLRLFYGAMSRHAGVRSVDPMTQVAIYQQEQTAMIRKLSEDLSGRLSDNVTSAVSKAVEPMTEALKGFITVSTKEQMRFLDAVAGRFVERMGDMMGRELDHLRDAIRDAAEGAEVSSDALRRSISETGELLENVRQVSRLAAEMVEGSAKHVEALEENRRRSDRALEKIASLVERMDLISQQEAGYLKSVSAMQAQVTHSVDQMSTSLKGFTDKAADNTGKSVAELIHASAELRATGAELGRIHADCTAAIKQELKDTMDAYQDYVNQFTRRVDYLAGGISASLEKLPAVVDDSTNRFLDEIDRMTDAMVEARRLINADRRA